MAKTQKNDFSTGPVWRRIVAQAIPLTILLPRLGFGVLGVFMAEPVSNVLGGLACFITMRLTVYKKIEKAIEGQKIIP